MELLATILAPISAAMAVTLEAINSIVRSYGLSIVILSFTVRLVLIPLTRWAARIEQTEAATQLAMRPEIATAKATLNGRERFERIDEIYSAHGYHPIYSLKSLSALALQIPFLLAALFLLVDYPPIAGVSFGPLADLGESDSLVGFMTFSFNLLPIGLTLVAVLETFLDPQATSASRMKFIFVAVVVLVLIYDFPAAVSLYWLASNVFSFLVQALRWLSSS